MHIALRTKMVKVAIYKVQNVLQTKKNQVQESIVKTLKMLAIACVEAPSRWRLDFP